MLGDKLGNTINKWIRTIRCKAITNRLYREMRRYHQKNTKLNLPIKIHLMPQAYESTWADHFVLRPWDGCKEKQLNYVDSYHKWKCKGFITTWRVSSHITKSTLTKECTLRRGKPFGIIFSWSGERDCNFKERKNAPQKRRGARINKIADQPVKSYFDRNSLSPLSPWLYL